MPNVINIPTTEPIRDSKGRYLPGHKAPGPGRPHKTRFYQEVFDKTFKREHFEKLLWKTYAQAMAGDGMQQRYLLDRFLGKIKEEVDITTHVEDTRSPEELRQEFLEAINSSGTIQQPLVTNTN